MAIFVQAIKARTEQEFPLLPLEEWNNRVVDASGAVDVASRYHHFPSIKIQATVDGMSRADQLARDVYEARLGETEAVGAPRLQTLVSERLSSTLGLLPVLGHGHVASWLSYWERAGLFTIS